MERSKNDAWVVKMLRNALVFSLLFASVSFATAQEKRERRGLWGEIGTDWTATSRTASDGSKESIISGSLNATIGLHNIFKVKDLQLGLGFNATGLAKPYDLGFFGGHLMAKYKPIKSMEGLRLTLQLTKPFISNNSYDVKSMSSLAIGWEFPRVFRSLGFDLAIGYSQTSYNYEFSGFMGSPNGNITSYTIRGKDNQGLFFFRLGILFN